MWKITEIYIYAKDSRLLKKMADKKNGIVWGIFIVVVVLASMLFFVGEGVSLSPKKGSADNQLSVTGSDSLSSGSSNKTQHTECVDQQCVLVNGPGPNECGGNQDCIPINQSHTECIGLACVVVSGPGANACSTNFDCQGNQTNQTHLACVGNACQVVQGAGINQCGSNFDCSNGTGNQTNQPPIAFFNAFPTSGQAPLSVSFIEASTDSDGFIADIFWNFGDGFTNSTEGSNFTVHTYFTPGSYLATLTVTDDDGATDDYSRVITVTGTNSTGNETNSS